MQGLSHVKCALSELPEHVLLDKKKLIYAFYRHKRVHRNYPNPISETRDPKEPICKNHYDLK